MPRILFTLNPPFTYLTHNNLDNMFTLLLFFNRSRLNYGLNESTSGAYDLDIIAGVDAKGNPETQKSSEYEQTDTPCE